MDYENMNKVVYYILLIFCITLIPLTVMGYLGTMVSDKYEVEHARIFVEIDSDKYTENEKQEILNEIDQLENLLRNQRLFILIVGICAFLGISYLLIKRQKLIKKTEL